MVKLLGCSLKVSEFKFLPWYYIHFQTNILGLILTVMNTEHSKISIFLYIYIFFTFFLRISFLHIFFFRYFYRYFFTCIFDIFLHIFFWLKFRYISAVLILVSDMLQYHFWSEFPYYTYVCIHIRFGFNFVV